MKLSKNKKAMDLAINFIVMLVLAMAIFGVGIFFVTKVFGQVDKQGDVLDQQTKTMLENKLRDSSLPVAFGKFKQTVKKGENVKFALGIANNEELEQKFIISIECAKAVKNGEEVEFPCPIPPKDKKISVDGKDYNKEISIDGKDYKTTALLFAINKDIKSATYIYNVIVTTNPPETDEDGEIIAHGGLQKLYIEVK